jgi:hypothetical protein
MSDAKPRQALGELVGGFDLGGDRTTRIEIRLLRPDAKHPDGVLFVTQYRSDGRIFHTPIWQNRAREFAVILDAGIRMLESGGDA